MRNKVDLIANFIADNSVIYGADKHLCLSAYLKEQGVDIPPETIRLTQTLDRAWRKALELNPELDYRGSTEDAENYVKRGMGYHG